MNYTAAQRTAIRTEGNQQIIATAGAGKSATISARVVRALKSGVPPAGIVALTYNEAAAIELKQKITALAREKLGEGFVGLSELFVGTVHGYCLHLLQNDLYRYRTYSVLTDVQARLLVSQYPNSSGLSSVRIVKGRRAGQWLTVSPRDISLFLETLGVAREEMVDPALLPQGLRQALEQWRRLLDRKRVFDYSRLLAEILWALSDQADPEHLRLQDRLAERLKYVVLDEAQDANIAMDRFLHRLHDLGACVCVCGDASQTIYQWRGASAQNFLSFPDRYPDVTVHALEDNFRSSFGVVETAQAIENGLTSRHSSRRARAASHHCYERGDILALAFATPEAEAAWIAGKMRALHGTPYQDTKDSLPRGLSWSDMAVLLRSTRKDAGPILGALTREGIPVVMRGMSSLFDAAEVEAAAVSFEYLAGERGAEEFRHAWSRADLGLTDPELAAGLQHLDAVKAWDDGGQGLCCLQAAFLKLLGAMGVHEERVPPTVSGEPRGEVVLFNLGKVSKAVADYQSICYRIATAQKLAGFAHWFRTEAPAAYEQGGDDAARVTPDAVQVLTCHKVKGLEFAAVWTPALQEGRFPSAVRDWGLNKWHLLPRRLVPDSGRYDGGDEDERRLFFVAATRSAKYAYFTWSPSNSDPRLATASRFFREVALSDWALTCEPQTTKTDKITSQARSEAQNIVLPWTALKYWHICQYQFKLRYLWGFEPPIAEEMGYGRSLHDASAEVRQRVREGECQEDLDVEGIVRRHFFLPYGSAQTRDRLLDKALRTMRRWLRVRGHTLRQVVMVEQEVEIGVGNLTVKGRIDVIKELSTGEVCLGDQKTDADAQALDTSRFQLYAYNLGYRNLVGASADLIEVETMTPDASGMHHREQVDADETEATERRLAQAARSIERRDLPPLPMWCSTCERCDHRDLCPTKHQNSQRMSP